MLDMEKANEADVKVLLVVDPGMVEAAVQRLVNKRHKTLDI